MTDPSIGQLRRGVEAHAWLRRTLGLPRPVASALVAGAKFARNPAQPARRRAFARAMEAPLRTEDGYRLLGPGEIPDAATIVADCRDLVAAARADGTLDRIAATSKKAFLHTVARDAALQGRPWFRAMIGPEMLGLATRHLGEVPLLAGMFLWWTPANETVAESQMWHRDGEDRTQLKIFVNVTDVDAACGPLTFIGAAASRRIRGPDASALGRRLDDAAFAGTAPRALTGPAGSGGAVDTSACFHYGSRGNRRERVVLMAQFTRFCAPKVTPAAWLPMAGLDPAQRLALGLR